MSAGDVSRDVPLYDGFSSTYDLMVDWPRRLANETAFFEKTFSSIGAQRVLDAACGTGHHARMFASWGLEVVGADASGGMIDQAREHPLLEGAASIDWQVADFLSLDEQVRGPFDALVCVGNSLPHLGSLAEVDQALAVFRRLLRPGGALVIQIRNVDRMYARAERILGPSSRRVGGEEHVFVRLYDLEPERMRLTIVGLTGHEGVWSASADSTLLIPLFSDELIAATGRAGFDPIEAHGDYHERPYEAAECDDLLLTAFGA